MLKIVKKVKASQPKTVSYDLYITRGDSAYIVLEAEALSDDDSPIELPVECVASVQVRDAPNGGNILFNGTIDVQNGVFVWHILPENTNNADKDNYIWDAQIKLPNGDVFTFIDLSRFIILPESTEEDL